MIRIFRKSWKSLKRTVSVAVFCLILSGLIAFPALAADVQGDVSVNNIVWENGAYNRNSYVSFSFPVLNSFVANPVYSNNSTVASTITVAPDSFSFNFTNPMVIQGTLGIYFSYYYVGNFVGSVVNPESASTYAMRVYTAEGFEYYPYNKVSFVPYAVSPVDGYTISSGYIFKGRTANIDSIVPVNRIWYALSHPPDGFVFSKPAGVPGTVSMCSTSVTLVTGVSSSDLDSLENIADDIASQSAIMSQFYGEVMSLLADIYSRLGSIEAVQEIISSYFDTLIPLVESLDSSVSNIHSLLQTQFQLLRTLIATESDDIQAAIVQQTQDLISYFDTVLSGSTGDMPEKSDDLETSVGNVGDAESDYQSTATQRFDQLADAFTGFSGGTLGGVTLAATLFTRVWDALGDYKIVYTWPLLLGLCLVVIGRLSRLSGGQSSSVRNRGDSDA